MVGISGRGSKRVKMFVFTIYSRELESPPFLVKREFVVLAFFQFGISPLTLIV